MMRACKRSLDADLLVNELSGGTFDFDLLADRKERQVL
jgi:hypothetical protein